MTYDLNIVEEELTPNMGFSLNFINKIEPKIYEYGFLSEQFINIFNKI